MLDRAGVPRASDEHQGLPIVLFWRIEGPSLAGALFVFSAEARVATTLGPIVTTNAVHAVARHRVDTSGIAQALRAQRAPAGCSHTMPMSDGTVTLTRLLTKEEM